MRFLTGEAILLEVVDLQERDRIVAFLTAHRGKKRGVARGARRRYSRFAGQLQPLAKVQITWFEKEGSELVRITDVDLLRSAHPLQSDLEGILLGSYLCDHLLEMAPENEANERLYRLLDSTLEALLAGVDRGLAARYFEAWMLRLSGIFPVPRECPRCGGALATAGAVLAADGEAILCRACGTAGGARGSAIGGEALRFLRRTGRENLAQLGEDPPPPAALAEVEEICARVRRGFLEHELRSYRVMRDTLEGLARPALQPARDTE